MTKKVSMLIIFSLFALISCGGPGRLTKNDITALPEKNFYITKVSVEHYSKRDFFIKGLSIEDPGFKKSVLVSLPVDAIAKILSQQLNISIDSSDFKKSITTINKPEWTSDKEDVNSIMIVYTLGEEKIAGFNFGTEIGLRMNCEIKITLADGKTKSIYISSPDQANKCYTPEKIANNKGVNVEEIVKIIVDADLKVLPERLDKMLKQSEI